MAWRLGALTDARRRLVAGVVMTLCIVALSACHANSADSTIPPRDLMDGKVLYAQNCSSCHGDRGSGGIAVALADPLYLQLAGDMELETIISGGRETYEMPAFELANGGSLSGQQIAAIVEAIRGFVPTPMPTPPPNVPPLHPANGVTGDAQRGQQAFAASCSRCHGQDGSGGSGGRINVPNVVALTSDDLLRRIVITGLPSRGMPDYAHLGTPPLTDQQVTDIVAFMATWRQNAAATPTPPSRQH